MACGSGLVLTAHVIDRTLEWDNWEVTLIRRKTIRVREIGNEGFETLEITDRVVQFEFAFDHLVVITPNQCHVYSVTNWNTPAIFDLKSGSISAVILSEKWVPCKIDWNKNLGSIKKAMDWKFWFFLSLIEISTFSGIFSWSRSTPWPCTIIKVVYWGFHDGKPWLRNLSMLPASLCARIPSRYEIKATTNVNKNFLFRKCEKNG